MFTVFFQVSASRVCPSNASTATAGRQRKPCQVAISVTFLISVFSMVQYLPSILSINKIPLFSGSSPPKCLPKPSPGLPLPCHLFPLRRCILFFKCYPIWVYLYICRFLHTLLQVLTLEEIERQAAAVRI